jgi:uncharacterized membrane protein YjjP (DUF1212 family)
MNDDSAEQKKARRANTVRLFGVITGALVACIGAFFTYKGFIHTPSAIDTSGLLMLVSGSFLALRLLQVRRPKPN